MTPLTPTPTLHPHLRMKTPKLTEAQEYGFQPGKLETLSQTLSHSLPILEFHPTLHSLVATTLHVEYFSWFERLLHLSRIRLGSHGLTKALGRMFRTPTLILRRHTDQLPPHTSTYPYC